MEYEILVNKNEFLSTENTRYTHLNIYTRLRSIWPAAFCNLFYVIIISHTRYFFTLPVHKLYVYI